MPVSPTNPLLNAGDLDRRVSLMKPLYNEWEDDITGWELIDRVWAAVEPVSPQPAERDESERMTSHTSVTVVIRYRSDIDARWRIEDGPHTYEVLGLADIARRRVQLRLACQEVI